MNLENRLVSPPNALKTIPARRPERQAGEGGTEWFTAGRFSFLLAACILAAYPEVVFGIRTFFFRDFGFFGYPLAYHHRESFWRGEVPLWNPLNNCGLPFLAQWNTLTLYPGSFLYLLLPLSWALGVFCLAHQFVAGLGMYFLARRWTGSGLGAAVAGMVFAFNGLTLNCLMWPNNIAALGWMPWVVLLVEQALPGGAQRVLSAIAVGALQMLAGAPEIILFTWLVAGLLFAAEWTRQPEKRMSMTVHFGLTILAVASLCAVQLLPFLDLLGHSQRDTRFAQSSWSMPGTGWANFLVPLFHCFSANQGVFFQYDQWWTSSYYLGIGPLALALLAPWRTQRNRIRLLALLALAGLVLALGDDGYLYRWLRHLLPQVGFLRFPVKFVVLVVFSLPLLAAYSINCFSPGAKCNSLSLRMLAGVWLGVLLIVAGILWFAHRYPFQFDEWGPTLSNAAWRAFFFTIFLGLLWCLQRRANQLLRHGLGVAVLMVTWVDTVTHAPRQNPTIPLAAYEPGLVRLSPPPGHGVCRAMISRAANLRIHFSSVASELNDYIGSRLALRADCNLLDRIPKIDGFFSLYLREANRICELLYFSSITNSPALLDFLSVAHVTAPDTLFDWEFRSSYLPFVSAGQQPVFAGQDETLAALFSPDFNPRQRVYLPEESKPFIKAAATSARVLSSHFAAHNAVMEVETSVETLVVIPQANHHFWRARVDGRDAKIWLANYAFLAVEIPQGTHRITLRYQDQSFLLGAGISIPTLLVCGIAAFRSRHCKPG